MIRISPHLAGRFAGCDKELPCAWIAFTELSRCSEIAYGDLQLLIQADAKDCLHLSSRQVDPPHFLTLDHRNIIPSYGGAPRTAARFGRIGGMEGKS